MCLRELKKAAPEAEERLRNQIVAALAQGVPMKVGTIVQNIDVSMIPPKPAGTWSGNPLAPAVIVMEVLEKLILDQSVEEDIGTMTYRLRYECGWPEGLRA